jgi:hypothetical protein
MPERGDLRCSIGLHRWTTGDGKVFICFRCHKQRAAGKAIRCRLGLHRWFIVRKEGEETYRVCFFCGKCNSLHDDVFPAAPGSGSGF